LSSLPVFGKQGLFELSRSSLPPDSDWSWDVALGDVDGDSDLDAIFANHEQNKIYLNDGSGVFADVTVTNFPANSYLSWGVALGDVDGDGDLDAIFANTNQNELYLNDGSGVFSDASLTNLPGDDDDTRDVALGDMDNDKDLDIVLANRFGRNRLYVNDGSGFFRDAPPASFSAGGGNTRGVALGDVDGDKDLDIVFAVKDAQNRLHLNDGFGVFIDVTDTHLPSDRDNSRSIALGDVDGDNDLDIVFANRLDSQSRLYLNDSSGVFTDATLTNLPIARDWSDGVALCDIDGDGDLDMVLANFNAQNRLYLNDGSGVFEDATAAQLPVDSDSSLGIALGDVDDDGDLDIMVANFNDNRLYTNLSRRSVTFGLNGCRVRS
jgi:hypothetical protein